MVSGVYVDKISANSLFVKLESGKYFYPGNNRISNLIKSFKNGGRKKLDWTGLDWTVKLI